MSNHLAVAAATRTLAQVLDAELTRDFVGAHVVPGRPDAAIGDDADPEVRLFLFRVEPHPSWRSDALPARTPAGETYEPPQVGLSLHYLLTCIGNESQLEPQRMLGSVVRTLNTRPLLSRAEIEGMVKAATAEDANHPLARSDLATQPDTLRLSSLSLTLDELSNLWSTFFQAPYRLSVACELGVVVLTADETPTHALPVRDRDLFITTMRRPTIQHAGAVDGPQAPLFPRTPLEIRGEHLRAEEETVVAVGGVEVTPGGQDVTGRRIEVAVPAGVRAGVRGVCVIHRRLMGEPPTRLAAQSNVFPIVIQPRLLPIVPGAVHDVSVDGETDLRSGVISVSVDPPVGAGQQVTLVLNAVSGGSAGSYVFPGGWPDDPEAPDETPDLNFDFRGVAPGDFLLRVTVGGAESPLLVDTVQGSATEGQYTGPVVTVP
jgi:hypothetical protein